MRRHMEVNHDGVRYQCKMCDKVYTKNSSLTKHMSRSHVTCDLKPGCWFLNTFFWPFLAFFGHNTSISLSIFWPSVTGCDLCNGRQAATSLGAHSGWGEVKMPVHNFVHSEHHLIMTQCISRTHISVQYTDSNAGNGVHYNNAQYIVVHIEIYYSMMQYTSMKWSDARKNWFTFPRIQLYSVVMWAALSSRGSDRGKGELCC